MIRRSLHDLRHAYASMRVTERGGSIRTSTPAYSLPFGELFELSGSHAPNGRERVFVPPA